MSCFDCLDMSRCYQHTVFRYHFMTISEKVSVYLCTRIVLCIRITVLGSRLWVSFSCFATSAFPYCYASGKTSWLAVIGGWEVKFVSFSGGPAGHLFGVSVWATHRPIGDVSWVFVNLCHIDHTILRIWHSFPPCSIHICHLLAKYDTEDLCHHTLVVVDLKGCQLA